MKVIDLLNKIAKGEATNETDFALKEDLKITNMNIFIEEYYLNTEVLNMEIEEKVRKIEPCDFDITQEKIKELDDLLQDKEKRWKKVKDYIANIYNIDLEDNYDDEKYWED